MALAWMEDTLKIREIHTLNDENSYRDDGYYDNLPVILKNYIAYSTA